MSITKLDFAEPFFSLDYIENEESYYIGEKSLVFNLARNEQDTIKLDCERVISSLKGAVIQDMTIKCLTRALIVKDFERTDIKNPATADKIMHTWKSLYEMSGIERHKGLPYYKSPKFKLGEGSNHMELNFCFVSQGGVPSGPHREHDRDFDEVHAQIAGCGMMRIYEYDNKERRHQELIMAPGTVHDKMYDSQGRYPWHEYMSVTPCIYCPIELDRGNENYNPKDL